LPSFHNTFDDKFEIVTNPFQKYIPKSEWQIKCGFKADPINSIHMIPTSSEGDSIQEKDTGTKIDNITIQNDHTQHNEFDNLNDDNNNNNQETITSEGDRNPTQIQNNNNVENIDDTTIITTRSGRISLKPQRYGDYKAYEVCDSTFDANHTICCAASNDPDTLYYHQILREQDKQQYILAMKKEIQQHNDNNNWKIVRRDTIPSDIRVLPSVWAMRRIREIYLLEK
jgi:hypothetical protein